MKEIMLPYILIVWLLFKFKVIKTNPRNYFLTTVIGIGLALSLFFGHRFFSPADLTNSTTVKAPHSVLSPAIGQQIDEIFVEHNQLVKKGEVLYTLHDEKVIAALADINAKIEETSALITAKEVDYSQSIRDLNRSLDLKEHMSTRDIEQAEDQVARISADQVVLNAKLKGLQAQKINLQFEFERLTIKAPFDGMITHVYLAKGSRIGSLHLWDINKKFVEMRIPDQAYRYIQKGQFSEFYIDAYPGTIFRARVHSIVKATGESQGSLFPQEQVVSNHILRGAPPVGRTVILEVDQYTMDMLPIGATGSAWISAKKPHNAIGFIDIIGGATVRLMAIESYIKAF